MVAAAGALAGSSSNLYKDIHHPSDLLPALASERASGDRNLILLTSNWAQYDLAVNLVEDLASVGLRNYFMLADNGALVEHARRRGKIAIAWSSMFERFAVSPNATTNPDCACTRDGDNRASDPPGVSSSTRWRHPACQQQPKGFAKSDGRGRALRCRMQGDRAVCGDQRCVPSAAHFYRCDSVRRLWLLRFVYTLRLVGLRYRVLLLDSDSLVLADPFRLISSHMHAVAAIGLEDASAWPQMGFNGGTWYFDARPGGPVHGVLRDFARRVKRTLEAYPAVRHYDESEALKKRGKRKPADFLLFDQTVINVALLDAVLGRRFELNSTDQRSPIGGVATAEGRRMARAWAVSCCHATPPSLGHAPWGYRAASSASNATERREVQRHYGRSTRLSLLSLQPSDKMRGGRRRGGGGGGGSDGGDGGGVEMVAKAPPWLFAAESQRGASGRTAATFWGATPPPAAVVHFVCSSWPGSDGRRAAMRLWGHWHAEQVEAEMDEGSRRAHALHRRAFVSFDARVDALEPKDLEPFLRLLTLVAHATRRTPVLPYMRCDAPGQRWVDFRVEPRTGETLALEQATVQAHGHERPCGWAAHEIAGARLPEPMCIQRPLEGCFLAFATPDELAPHVPRGYWNGTAAAHSQLPPAVELLRRSSGPPPLVAQALSASPPVRPTERDAPELTLDELLRLVSPFALPPADDAGGAVPSAAALGAPPVLLLRTPSAAAVRAQPLLHSLERFDGALATLVGKGLAKVDRGLQLPWHKCLKMVRNNKCGAVC